VTTEKKEKNDISRHRTSALHVVDVDFDDGPWKIVVDLLYQLPPLKCACRAMLTLMALSSLNWLMQLAATKFDGCCHNSRFLAHWFCHQHSKDRPCRSCHDERFLVAAALAE
jgi:hypothetical protein